ncbi:MAG: protein phosphatase 2C domain-containing protein [Clostridia bacterium]|nr:protein phosphatase 2C domain-containing protein [Clostridia bacterium]
MFYIKDFRECSVRHRKSENEDKCLHVLVDPAPTAPQRMSIQCVVDGVSKANGKLAAELAVRSFYNGLLPLLGSLYDLAEAEEEYLDYYIRRTLCQAVMEADSMLRKNRCAATLSCAVVFRDRLFVCNVGDSPVYLIDFKQGVLTGLYENHNAAGYAVREGLLSREEALSSPLKNKLVLALGRTTPLREEEIFTDHVTLSQDCVLLLGSDGALSVFGEDILREIVCGNADHMAGLCQRILDEVENSSSTDNFTIMATRIQLS